MHTLRSMPACTPSCANVLVFKAAAGGGCSTTAAQSTSSCSLQTSDAGLRGKLGISADTNAVQRSTAKSAAAAGLVPTDMATGVSASAADSKAGLTDKVLQLTAYTATLVTVACKYS
jgi:hypothetical protein